MARAVLTGQASPVKNPTDTRLSHRDRNNIGVRIAIACVGVAFVIAGIVNGNAGRVLIKAVNICLPSHKATPSAITNAAPTKGITYFTILTTSSVTKGFLRYL